MSSARSIRSTLLALSLVLARCSPPAATDAGDVPNDLAMEAAVDSPAEASVDVPGNDIVHTACTIDRDCDDMVFCNGVERCMPGASGADGYGCVRGAAPACLATQRCNEAQQRCETICAMTPDADGDGHMAQACGGDDCDDGDAMRFPGNTEVCDALGHDEDCVDTTFGHRDNDLDGYDDVRCCNTARDGMQHCGDDCDDQVRAINPNASEVCDRVDNNCNAMTDEGVTVAGFLDDDHDLHGDPAHAMNACAGSVGFSPLGDDCDDTNPARNPTQVEICDSVDNNCNGMVDDNTRAVTWYADSDGDGFGNASSGTTVSCTPVPRSSLLATDCDDMHRNVSPAAPEQCDGIDNDCNGLADFVVGPNNLEDDDNDGAPDLACPRLGTDCDDRDSTILPGAAELCDARDNDCDGTIDDGTGMHAFYADADGDGFGDMNAAPMMSCTVIAGRVTRGGDCDDTNPHRHPGVDDVCNGVDDNCDGSLDEDSPRVAFYNDADHDGFGSGMPVLACTAPAGLAAFGGDCADTDALRHPGAPERCNALDDDCDGLADNGATQVFHVDADMDGYGVSTGATMIACIAGPGWAPNTTDCDDTRSAVHPMATDTCDGLDNDCSGAADDEPAASTSCTAANASSTCNAGTCAITSCASGFLDCDGTMSNGCETPNNSTSNCGACRASCTRANAAATCSTGTCDYSSCILGFGDCDSNRGNGCETSLRTLSNCGACGNACPSGSSCFGGSCVCPGTAPMVCSGTCADLSVDRNNCGSCGNRCTVTCVSSGCLTARVTAGNGSTCAALSDGSARCWGANSNGQLGDGTTSAHAAPTPVAGVTNLVQLCTGNAHGCGVRADGTVWCWGANNASGQLGNGTTTASLTPVQAVGVTNAVEVSCGTAFSCARLSNGEVMCWGQGTFGQIGDGGMLNRPTPVRLSLTNVSQIATAANGNNTCAVHGDGTLHCWGHNVDGNIGDGSNTPHSTPTPVGLTDVRSVSMAPEHTCALTNAGAVYCWGSGSFGAIGNRTTSSPNTPTRATEFTGTVVSVAAIETVTCAAYSTGAVYCLGANGSGQLGDGTTNQNISATQVIGLGAVQTLSGGNDHTCATDNDGTVHCWGGNSIGQLGDGTTTPRTTPVLVTW